MTGNNAPFCLVNILSQIKNFKQIIQHSAFSGIVFSSLCYHFLLFVSMHLKFSLSFIIFCFGSILNYPCIIISCGEYIEKQDNMNKVK